jgi:hypothetical protein
VLYSPAFKKIIGESFLPKEKLKLKMKNEVTFTISRFPFPFLILAKLSEKIMEKPPDFFPLGIQVGSQQYERISHLQPNLAKLCCG